MENKLKKDKQGAEKYLSPFLFVILTIVAGGIFAMVYVFYSAPYDIRNVEANVLLNNVADCVSYVGRIDTNLISNGTNAFQKTGADFLKDCHLNFDTIEWTEEQYYTEINFYKIDNLDTSVLDIKAGNNNWLADCKIQENKIQASLPQCTEKSFYSLDDKNNQYIIKILTAVRKTEKNAKI
jgi:hypothetical protein